MDTQFLCIAAKKNSTHRTLRETCEQTEQYRYDNCNRLTKLEITPKDASTAHSSVSYQYDKQGNMLSDGNNTYSYDGFNRMAQVQTAEGRIQKNSYDAEGLRHEMEENGQLVKFLYNENREVVAEEESTGNIIRYIRGLGLISSDSENARTYYHYVSDEQGSITHMVDGENGTIPNHYTYDAFGNTIHCEEQVHNRFRYNGEQYDPVTSQYYLRARFYNPAIARFTQEDTYYGDGLNLYRYCANNPVAYQDPSGHNICPGQLDLYKKYRAEGMSPRDAYDRMRTELGLSSKNPFTKDSEGGTVSVLQKQLEARYGNPSGGLAYKGGANTGYYQDANGRWHRPNGQFASNSEVGISSNSEHYLHRPYIRQDTIDAVNANTRVNYKTGQIYDPISTVDGVNGIWVDPSNVELGHTTGNEFDYYRDMAESQGWTQEQFNDFMNNPEFYAWQDVHYNRSHAFEEKH